MDLTTEMPRLGVWCNLGAPAVTDLLTAAGFDWLCLDAQHGALDDGAILNALRVPAAATTRRVRVARNDPALIGRALDAGADGVIVPMVQNAEEAAQAAAACRYPPLGRRSWGPISAVYGRSAPDAATANQGVHCAVMVETAEALEQVQAIAATPGVDEIFVGPYDLSLALGITLDGLLGDASILDSMVGACRDHGIAAGAFGGTAEMGRRLIERGFGTVAVATDSGLAAAGAQAVLDGFRTHRPII